MHIIIIGCGRVGSALAKMLAEEKHNVVIIDKNSQSFERLGHSFNGITLKGIGFDLEVLEKAGIEKADIFISVTNGDNSNFVALQVAERIYGVPRAMARINDPERAKIYAAMGYEILSPTTINATMIKNLIMGNVLVNNLHFFKNSEVVEFLAGRGILGKKPEALNLAGEFQVAAVIRQEKVILAEAKTILEEGDRIVGVCLKESLPKIKKMYHYKQEVME